MKRFSLLAALLALLAPVFTFAHEGHGHFSGYTLQHYFASGEHLGIATAIIISIVVGIFAAIRFKRSKL